MRTPARRAAGMEDIRRGRCRATRQSEGACDAIGPETRLSGKADRCRCPCRCPMTTMTPLRLHVLVPSNHASFALVHCSGCSSVVAQRSEAREARHGSTTSSASSSHIHPFTLTSRPPTCSTHDEPPKTVPVVRRQHPNMQREETGERRGGQSQEGTLTSFLPHAIRASHHTAMRSVEERSEPEQPVVDHLLRLVLRLTSVLFQLALALALGCLALRAGLLLIFHFGLEPRHRQRQRIDVIPDAERSQLE